MKKLLVLTDFSLAAKHAAIFAYRLAKQIEGSIILCNVVIFPAEVPQAGLVVWPLEKSEVLLRESNDELARLKMELEKMDDLLTPIAAISIRSDSGILLDVVREISAKTQVDFIIMAEHGAGLSGLLIGNHCKTLIDDVGVPLFIIPPPAKNTPIKRIAFASNFENPDTDLKFISKLVVLAALLDAEIFITHVFKQSQLSAEFDKSVQKIMLDISCENDYPKIYYKGIKSLGEKKISDWLMVQHDMDLLVMVHHHQGFFDRLLKGSLTQKLANALEIPLLVFKKAIDPPPL